MDQRHTYTQGFVEVPPLPPSPSHALPWPSKTNYIASYARPMNAH